MDDRARLFAEELRRIRLAAGVSLSELAKRVHYSKGYLSKIETGVKPAGTDLARRCDAALDAGGELVALVEHRGPASADADGWQESWAGDGWMLNLESNGSSWFNPVTGRDTVDSGTALLAFGLTERHASAAAQQETTIAGYQKIFEQHRLIGQTTSPALVLPALIAQTHTLRGLAKATRSPMRVQFLQLASRYAEYVGWMTQEAGNDRATLWWTQSAVEMANAAGDLDLAAHSLVRNALIALYRDDAKQTVELSRQAQADPKTPVRIRGLAALREAQGHALAGDDRLCRNTLDRAKQLLETVVSSADGMVLGTTVVSNMAPMVTGWCMYDLGRPAEAAEILADEIARLPVSSRRAHARFGARLALSHAAAGDIDHACSLTHNVLDSAELVDSATVRFDLRRIGRTLARWPSHSSVRDLQPRLTTALHAPAF
ncbi:helix-turn-helix domain-containing protein [Kibdelosporangium philippinense]|uniref:Helix-turn-helix domain-containing protein n=1 Tax=Kibdelosporangium philippinense TaxID=211113 RepID=A0ABS8Z6F7_9PSEU|nr:helix-turn-helix transcriptional regulator [Kibdelosporangium philippinense]MCE7003466.1 helix-turn-helix domain-containing protein [Kibdelosporangium philippinense]